MIDDTSLCFLHKYRRGRKGLLTIDVKSFFRRVTSDWQSVMIGLCILRRQQLVDATATARVSIANADGGVMSFPWVILTV